MRNSLRHHHHHNNNQNPQQTHDRDVSPSPSAASTAARSSLPQHHHRHIHHHHSHASGSTPRRPTSSPPTNGSPPAPSSSSQHATITSASSATTAHNATMAVVRRHRTGRNIQHVHYHHHHHHHPHPHPAGTPSSLGHSSSAARERRLRQGRLLLVSLLENFCMLYDQSPERNKRLFFVLCKQLSAMGIISNEDFIDEVSAVRGSYKRAFRDLVVQAMQAIQQEQLLITDGDHERNDETSANADLNGGDGLNRSSLVLSRPPSMSGSSARSRFLYNNVQIPMPPLSAHSSRSEDSGPNFPAGKTTATPQIRDFSELLDLQTSRYHEDFQEIRLLGHGAFGLVSCVRNKIDGVEYAVKRIRLRSSVPNSKQGKKRRSSGHNEQEGLSDFERILREVKVQARLSHPNVVKYVTCWFEHASKDGGSGSDSGGDDDSFDDDDDNDDDYAGLERKEDKDIQNFEEFERDVEFMKTATSFSSGTNLETRAKKQAPGGDTSSKKLKDGLADDDFNSNDISIEFMLEDSPPGGGDATAAGRNFSQSDSDDDDDDDDDDDSSSDESVTDDDDSDIDGVAGVSFSEKKDSKSVGGSLHTASLHTLSSSSSTTSFPARLEPPRPRSASHRGRSTGPSSRTGSTPNYRNANIAVHRELTLFIQMELCGHSLQDYLVARNRHLHSRSISSSFSPPHSSFDSANISVASSPAVDPLASKSSSSTSSESLLYASAMDGIDLSESLAIFKDICEGLAYIHEQSCIHRDIAPKNVFFVPADDMHNGRSGLPSFSAPWWWTAQALSGVGSGGAKMGLPRGRWKIGDFGLVTTSLVPGYNDASSTRSSSFSELMEGGATLTAVASSASLSPPPTPMTAGTVLANFELQRRHSESLNIGSMNEQSHDAVSEMRTPPNNSASAKMDANGISNYCRTTNVGTIVYASPEQLNPSPLIPYTSRSDLFSLGIVLFELLYPFGTAMERVAVLSGLRNGVMPDAFLTRWPKEATLILWLMNEDPSKRPTAREVLEILWDNGGAGSSSTTSGRSGDETPTGRSGPMPRKASGATDISQVSALTAQLHAASSSQSLNSTRVVIEVDKGDTIEGMVERWYSNGGIERVKSELSSRIV